MPATKVIVDKILNKNMQGLTSMVMCFEDAIPEKDVPNAEINVIGHLDRISGSINEGSLLLEEIPLIFLRVRSSQQFRSFARKLRLNQLNILSGFVFPKIDSSNANEYYSILESFNKDNNINLYGMPILEGSKIALTETRENELSVLREIFRPFKDITLNIRVGVNDFSSIFGVRRGINYSIYDILTVRDCLADILNHFTRDGEDYIVSAPVWEYFLADKKEDIAHLMASDIHKSLLSRNAILNEAVDGLLREVILDKANGFVGKTIIHPSHVKFVNAMQTVTREEYEDACQVISSAGGVAKGFNNKMNESNPHRNWAVKTIKRAEAFGVVENESCYLKLALG